mgnify:CR=1 FL=1
MSRIINGNNSVSSSLMARAKQSTLENYAKAATLGEPKAAHNCYKFLERIQERLRQEVSAENEKREKLFLDIAFLYLIQLAIGFDAHIYSRRHVFLTFRE